MTREIKKELNQATRLYRANKREEAFEIYDRHFRQNPDELRYWDKIRYCWSIYHMHIKDSLDEDELMLECVENLILQKRLCVREEAGTNWQPGEAVHVCRDDASDDEQIVYATLFEQVC